MVCKLVITSETFELLCGVHKISSYHAPHNKIEVLKILYDPILYELFNICKLLPGKKLTKVLLDVFLVCRLYNLFDPLLRKNRKRSNEYSKVVLETLHSNAFSWLVQRVKVKV